MKKIYEAINSRVFSMSATVNGDQRRITFTDGDSYRTARYTTSDEKEQKAIEESTSFGRDVRIFSIEKPIEKEVKVDSEIKETKKKTPSVKNDKE